MALACAALVPAMSGVARADVDGQIFNVKVTSTVSGTFDGELEFFANGTWALYVDDAPDGSGPYTQTGNGTTEVSGRGTNGAGYIGKFTATAKDPKQQGGIQGVLAKLLKRPSKITGSGFGNAGDIFRFTGTEIVP